MHVEFARRGQEANHTQSSLGQSLRVHGAYRNRRIHNLLQTFSRFVTNAVQKTVAVKLPMRHSSTI